MSSGKITKYVEGRITRHAAAEVLKPSPVHSHWANFASQRSVRAIAIAPQSHHLWLATWGGVLSWNRKEEQLYRRYSSEHGLAGNAVACICVDCTESPWVGHVEGGLSYFDGERWQAYDHLQDEFIRLVCSAGGSGGIWAAGTETVYRILGPDQPPTPVAQGDDGAVNALALLAEGDDLLLGNAWGVFRLRTGQKPQPIARETIRHCTALTRDGDGGIWLSTPEAVYRLDGEMPGGPLAPGQGDPVGRIVGLAAGKERIWVLTTAGLAHVTDNQWNPIPWPDEQEDGPALRAIAAGIGDVYLWVGTDRLLAGVYVMGSETRWDFDLLPSHSEDDLNNLGRCVTPIRKDDKVWIGTAGGLVAFGPGDKWTTSITESDIRALSLSPTADDPLWILAWPQGVGRLISPDLPNFDLLQPPGLPVAVAAGQDGCPYVATGRALWQLDVPDDLHEYAQDVPALVRCLTQTSDGVWWLGTTQGVYHLTPEGWTLAGEQPGPLQAEVYGLTVVGDTLWAATEAGLWARRGEGWVLHGPESEAVWALAPASRADSFWLARRDGILYYDSTDGTMSEPYTLFNSGLSSRRVTALAEINGDLWVITQAGISRLELSQGGANNE